jgi:hypothetical protein
MYYSAVFAILQDIPKNKVKMFCWNVQLARQSSSALLKMVLECSA